MSMKYSCQLALHFLNRHDISFNKDSLRFSSKGIEKVFSLEDRRDVFYGHHILFGCS